MQVSRDSLVQALEQYETDKLDEAARCAGMLPRLRELGSEEQDESGAS